MSERLTKAAARNVFYGGTVAFFLLLVALVAHSHSYVLDTSTNKATLTDEVVHGKRVWEKHSCINCHTLLGEGAYFAPELSNVWDRYGGREDEAAAREGLKNWIRSQPTGVEGRRQMPHFDLTEPELDALVDFFRWTDSIKTQGWPPHKSG